MAAVVEMSARDLRIFALDLAMLRREMRALGDLIVAAAIAATLYATLHAQPLDATQVLTAARMALGGEERLSAVRTFTATGRTRQVRGNNLVPVEFEINCELPDRFVRTDEFPAQETGPTTLGFIGDDLIQFPPPPAGRAAGSAPPPLTLAQQRLASVKQRKFEAPK
jgi:hypothetical protein